MSPCPGPDLWVCLGGRLHQQTASERSPSRCALESPDPWTRVGLKGKGKPTVPEGARHLSSPGAPAGSQAAGPPAEGCRTRAEFPSSFPGRQLAEGRWWDFSALLPVATGRHTCARGHSLTRVPRSLVTPPDSAEAAGASGSRRRTEDLSPLHSSS